MTRIYRNRYHEGTYAIELYQNKSFTLYKYLLGEDVKEFLDALFKTKEYILDNDKELLSIPTQEFNQRYDILGEI